MLHHKFIILDGSDLNDVRNVDSEKMIRISDRFISKYSNAFSDIRFKWSGYKTRRKGLCPWITNITHQAVRKIKKNLVAMSDSFCENEFEKKEYYKLLDFLTMAILDKNEILHVAT